MSTEHSDYIERNQDLLEFFIRTNQCGTLTIPSLRKWLSNFHNEEGKYYAIRMLKHFLYYSDSDVTALLRFCLDYFIKEKPARQQMLEAEFKMLPYILNPELQKSLNRTIFMPLLSDNKPTESGEEIIRLLSKKISVPDANCIFHWSLTDELLEMNDRIVIVDDNIGSGDQLLGFWKTPQKLSYGNFDKLLEKYPHEVVYLCLVAVSETVIMLKNDFPNLTIIASEQLNEKYRVFSDNSYFWKTQKERDLARLYIQQLAEERGIPFLGYNNMDFALLIGKTIPDWALPVFWYKDSPDWVPLIT